MMKTGTPKQCYSTGLCAPKHPILDGKRGRHRCSTTFQSERNRWHADCKLRSRKEEESKSWLNYKKAWMVHCRRTVATILEVEEEKANTLYGVAGTTDCAAIGYAVYSALPCKGKSSFLSKRKAPFLVGRSQIHVFYEINIPSCGYFLHCESGP